ncbi:MAG: septum formation initiator family protein [Bacteroidales bacterium]|nr:septum formation initiator family protein [Bacteroidales bacterium]
MKIFRIIAPITKNKYLLTLFIFLVWLSFFDRDNWIDRYQGMNDLETIEAEKKMYEHQIIQDKESLEKLKDPEYLEKFAREEHHMKKDNEDLFIIEEK